MKSLNFLSRLTPQMRSVLRWPHPLVLGMLLRCGAAAHAGSPTLAHLVPAGGTRGTEVEVTVHGNHLADLKGLLFYDPGFTTLSVSEASDGKCKVKIRIAPEAALGEHLVRVWTATGLGEARTFYVSPYPLVKEANAERDGKSAARQSSGDEPQPIALASTIWGTLRGDEVDRFAFPAKKGDRLSAEAVGVRLQSREILDPLITLSKADGTVIAECDDSSLLLQDPVLSVIAPEDGRYILAIRDSTNIAPAPGNYLLHVGNFPRPLTVFPPGGQIGEKLAVTYLGDASGPMPAVLALPDHASELFAVFPEQNGLSAPSPNWLRVSPFPNVLEREPDNDVAHATAANGPLPLAYNGLIEKPDDVDFFQFTTQKDHEYNVEVFARRLRSPLDSVLSIFDEKGNRMAQNDDNGGPDSALKFRAPKDGSFFFSVKDQLGRGGPTYVYRVEITEPKPELALWLPEMQANSQERQTIVVPKGNRTGALIRVKRENTGSDLALEPSDLPAGVTVAAGNLLGSVDTTLVVFSATPEASLAAQTFSFTAKPLDGKPLSSRVAHAIDVSENGNQTPFYRITADKLAVSVADPAPFSMTLVEPKVPLVQQGAMNLKVMITRQEGFKKAIDLALLYAPPGVNTAGSAVIKEGETEGVVALSANGDAPLKKWKIAVVGSTDSGKGAVWVSTQLAEIEVAPAFYGGQIVRSFIDQGEKSTITVKLQNKTAFDGKAKLRLLGLPNKVSATEVEISKEDTEAKFSVQAEAASPVGRHTGLFCQLTVMQNGEPIVQSFAQGGILRIDKASATNVAASEVKPTSPDAKP